MKRALCAVAGLAANLAATMPVIAADVSGAQLFDRYCVHCHGPGNEGPGTLQLARTRGQDKALLTERSDLRPEYVEYVVRHGLKAMPAFVPSELTDAELRVLAEFLSN